MNDIPQEALEIVKSILEKRAENKLKYFKPYSYQKEYINKSSEYTTRFMMAGNRCGKTVCAAYEACVHATGRYPRWWKGRRWERPVRILCAGVSHTTTRDILQAAIVGDPTIKDRWGTAMLPKDCIGSTMRKPGIPGALAAVKVRHASGGWSTINFLSYESGKEAFMGTSYHAVYLDEEPPMDIYSQAIRAVTDTDGIISITATPENGVTELVASFINDDTGQRYVMNVSWDDAPHLTEDVKQRMLAELPPHERDMRSKGIPVLGTGLVYPVPEEKIKIAPFEIPDHWPRIAGIDFGIDHPTAWVAVAFDNESDTAYVYDAMTMTRATPDVIAAAIKRRGGAGVPTAWPHDGLIQDKTSGRCLKDMYSEEGIYMLPDKFSNPPDPGKPEGSGGHGVEAGIMEIWRRMEDGRFKVFANLEEWFKELRLYHRKNGKIVKKNDDLMDATRYAVMSRRFALPVNHKFEAYIPHIEDFSDPLVAY